ncbi:metal ABC transporter ATP-binding protein [Natrialbaceae archaeon A-gly3]
MNPVVTVEDVTFAYGEKLAVEDISLSVEQGDFLGLIGPNGSGKTTLLHLMLGLQQPDSGSVELFGEPAQAFEDGERIGYVAQRSTDRGGTMPITVREAVTMGRFAHVGHSRLRESDYEIVDDALRTVEIIDLADRRINQLSGGQRQRAFIARALASEADLLALDEPTVGVDAESRDRFYGLLDDLNREGITIILIEHDIDVLTKHVNKIACINKELYHHGDTVSFIESDALAEAYGAAHGVVEHDHP